MIKKMDKEVSHGLMEVPMKDNGKMVNNTEKENSLQKKEK